MMKRNRVVLLVVYMGIFSILFGCRSKNPVEVNLGTTKEPLQNITESEEIKPIEFPEGTTLTGLYLNQMGMMRTPYYMMKVTESGTYMKISDSSPDDYNMWKDAGEEEVEQPAEYFGYIETVKDVEYASHVKLEDETLLRELEEIIEKYGALGWDGFNESVDMPNVMDAGDSYDLYLELSDGTTVTMHGYNTNPPGFDELYSEVVAVFQANSDYSRYMASNFTDSKCTYMEVELRDKSNPASYYMIRMQDNTNQWAVMLQDPDGVVLDKGTDVSDYKETNESLPYDRFLRVMSKYHVEEWNQYEKSSSSAGKFFITLYFADGKEFYASGNEYPEGFDAFKKEFINEIYGFYLECKE